MTEHIIYMDDVESIYVAKYFIEKQLLETKQITEKTDLGKFIQTIVKVNDNIAIFNILESPEIVPFGVYILKDDVYIFFTEKTNGSEQILKKLRESDYILSGMKPYVDEPNMIKINNVNYALEI